MTTITGHLSQSEIATALYVVRFWTRDSRNHRYRREDIDNPRCGLLEPQCTGGAFTPPRWYAFPDELIEASDDAQDCRPCFPHGRPT